MSDYCVVVADGCRARFFTLDPVEFPDVESGPRLTERGDLVNTEREAEGRSLWSNVKSGRNRAPGGGPAHGYDDHREQHEDEFERRFARQVAQEAARMAQAHKVRQLVLVAQQRMMGLLRAELGPVAKAGVACTEFVRDLSKMPPQTLHERLAKAGLLPQRRQPAAG